MLWKTLLAPALLTLALATTVVSSASAAAAPAASDAVEAQATLPAQDAPNPDHVRITDPKVACEHQNLHPALPPLCGLWLPKTLPAPQQEAIGHIIVRVANASTHAPGIKDRLVERCERYLAAHPDDNSLRTRICRRIVAGETVSPEELRSLREAGPAAQGAQDGKRKQRPALQGAPGTLRPRPAVTATPAS